MNKILIVKNPIGTLLLIVPDGKGGITYRQLDGKLYNGSREGLIPHCCEGKSAYDVAVENGFEGSEQEWLDSLVGPPGESGESGSSDGVLNVTSPKDETSYIAPGPNPELFISSNNPQQIYIAFPADENQPGGNIIIEDNSIGDTSSITNTISGNNIGEHDNGKGVITEINETVTTLIDNNNNTFTYTSEDGTQTLIAFPPSSDTNTTYQLSRQGNSVVLVGSDGSTSNIDIVQIIGSDSLVDNGDGTYTHTSVNGQSITFSTGSGVETTTTLVDNGDGTYTYTSEDNTQTTIVVPDPLDETTTTLVDNGNGTFTYTNEDGVATTVSLGGSGDTYTFSRVGDEIIVFVNGTEVNRLNVCCDGTVKTTGDETIGGEKTFTDFTTFNDDIEVIGGADFGGSVAGTQFTVSKVAPTFPQELTRKDYVDAADTALQTDINTKDATNVKTTGNQSIGGVKTFDDDIIVDGDADFNGNVNFNSGANVSGIPNTPTSVTNKDYVDNSQVTTTLVDNGDGTYTYTSEDNTQTTVDTNGSGGTAGSSKSIFRATSQTVSDGAVSIFVLQLPIPGTYKISGKAVVSNTGGTYNYAFVGAFIDSIVGNMGMSAVSSTGQKAQAGEKSGASVGASTQTSDDIDTFDFYVDVTNNSGAILRINVEQSGGSAVVNPLSIAVVEQIA